MSAPKHLLPLSENPRLYLSDDHLLEKSNRKVPVRRTTEEVYEGGKSGNEEVPKLYLSVERK